MRSMRLTSDALQTASLLTHTNQPLRLAVRRMRWFRVAFERYVEAMGTTIGCAFELDRTKVGSVFVSWLRAIEHEKPADKTERRDFFEFAAALMLSELTAHMPLRAKNAPTAVAEDSPAGFWPEGYVCTAFCLAVHAAAIEQEFQASTELVARIDDLSFWWSFRENALDQPRLSAGFFQAMLGHEPNWTWPDIFNARSWARPDANQ